jgi:peptide/nickel transport system substrate-binding protein
MGYTLGRSDRDPRRLSRRSLLRGAAGLSALTALSGVLAACGQQASAPAATTAPAPTAAPAAAAKPTDAAKPAAPAVTTAPAAPAAAATTAPAAAAPTPTSAAAAAAKPAAKPKTGGTLRVGQVGDIARLDGQLVNAVDTLWMPFDRLTTYDEKLQPQPMLAESWEVSSDYKQIKLNLRKGVQFHTGREFTSDDVKWNIMHVRDPKVAAGALILQSNWFTGIDTPDKNTIILKSEQPRPAVFDFFEFFDIIDPVTAEGPDAATKYAGTGPFALAEWVQGDHLRFTKNKSYWQSGKPYLDEIVVTIMRDPQAMITQLEAGAIDVALAPPIPDFSRFKGDPKYSTLTVPSNTQVIGANTTLPPTDNKMLRQALNYAIDRKRMVDNAFGGTATPQSLLWLDTSEAFDPSKKDFYAYDIDKAKALLAKAGLSNLEFDIVSNVATPEYVAVSQIFQFDLQKLGIKANIKTYEPAAYLDWINNHKYTGTYIGSTAYASMLPSTRIANSRHLDPSGNSNTGYKSDAYTDLYTKLSTEPDAAKRKQLYGQLNDLFLDESCVMPICMASARMLTTSKVHDVGVSQHGAFLYNDAWLE